MKTPITNALSVDLKALAVPPTVELFGHVTLVESYETNGYIGCHALVALRDTPGTTIAVITTSERHQLQFDAALTTDNLIAFRGSLLTNPPTPLGGTWAVKVYGNVLSVILYNTH
jgi:hypothetical protein